MSRRRGQCHYPGCDGSGRSTYAKYDIRLCDDHWNQLSDYTFLPCRHHADIKLRTIIELEFLVRCSSSVARRELRGVEGGSIKVVIGGTAPWAEWRSEDCLTPELLMLIRKRFGIRDPLGDESTAGFLPADEPAAEPVARAVKTPPLPRKARRRGDALEDF